MFNVLIVDDEIAILNGLKRVIPWEEYGLEIVAQATSGADALEILDRLNIDIMLTDIQMPGMTGLDLIERAHMQNHFPSTIILTAYDHFEYVKKAINLGVENYLLKPINGTELSSTLIKTIENIQLNKYKKLVYDDVLAFRENLLNRWVTGEIQIPELIERAELTRIDLSAKEYIAVIVKLLDSSEKKNPVFVDSIKQLILSDYSGNMFTNSSGQIVFILHPHNGDKNIHKIENSVQTAVERSYKLTGISSFATIGKPVSSFEHVSDSYQSALSLQAYSMFRPANSVVLYNLIANAQSIDILSDSDFMIFWEAILEGSVDFAEEFIKNILKKLSSAKYITLHSMKALVLELLFRIMRELRRSVKNDNELPHRIEYLIASFDSIKSFNELQMHMDVVVSDIIDFLEEYRSKQSPLTRRAIAYIEKHYAEELSLKTLALQFNINTSYLGQLLKNDTGELFSEYINKIRIKKAKELLLTTNHKINTIAKTIGYSNDNYFCKVFKKYTGTSPLEFRSSSICD